MTRNDSSFPLPYLTVRQLITATLVVALVGAGFWLLFRFHQVVLIFIAAVIISIAIRPVVTRLRRLGVPSKIGVLLVYALLLLLLAAFLRFGSPLIAEQVSTIGESLSEGYAGLRRSIVEAPNLLLARLGTALPEALALPTETEAVPEEAVETVPALEEQMTGDVGTMADRVLLSGLGFVALFILAYYWTLESERIKRSFYLLLPSRHRETARELVGDVEERIAGFVSGQLILSLIIGVLAFVAYLIIGLPYALLLAVFAGVMAAIPLVGAVIGTVPALVVAFSISPTAALWVVVAIAAIQQAEGSLLSPRIMKHTLGVRPLVTLLALIAFGSLFGVLGALIALPLASVIQLLLERSLLNSELEGGDTGGRDRATLLRYETQELVKDVRHVLRTREDVATATRDQIEDSIEAIALDLDSLLAQQSVQNGAAIQNGAAT